MYLKRQFMININVLMNRLFKWGSTRGFVHFVYTEMPNVETWSHFCCISIRCIPCGSHWYFVSFSSHFNDRPKRVRRCINTFLSAWAVFAVCRDTLTLKYITLDFVWKVFLTSVFTIVYNSLFPPQLRWESEHDEFRWISVPPNCLVMSNLDEVSKLSVQVLNTEDEELWNQSTSSCHWYCVSGNSVDTLTQVSSFKFYCQVHRTTQGQTGHWNSWDKTTQTTYHNIKYKY